MADGYFVRYGANGTAHYAYLRLEERGGEVPTSDLIGGDVIRVVFNPPDDYSRRMDENVVRLNRGEITPDQISHETGELVKLVQPQKPAVCTVDTLAA